MNQRIIITHAAFHVFGTPFTNIADLFRDIISREPDSFLRLIQPMLGIPINQFQS